MRSEQVSPIFLLAIAVLVCKKSLDLGLGGGRNPGPGLIPFVSAILLGCLSIGIFIKGTLEKQVSREFGKDWKKGLWVLGSLIFYVLCLERLGFLITTLIFLIFSLLSFRPRKVASIILISFLTVIISYPVFGLWLKVQLPKGILWI